MTNGNRTFKIETIGFQKSDGMNLSVVQPKLFDIVKNARAFRTHPIGALYLALHCTKMYRGAVQTTTGNKL